MNAPPADLTVPISACPICFQTDEVGPLCSVGEYPVLNCAQCGTEFLANPPDEQALGKMHDRADCFEGGVSGGSGRSSACFDD